MQEKNDFLLENKLYTESKQLHTLFFNSVFALQNILEHYTKWFPTFTDHSVLHSTQVINFCNNLIGTENIKRLNCDEVYILLMGCYLHDSGMGVSEKDFYEFKDKIVPDGKIVNDPNTSIADCIRKTHHEFSGQFIKKYSPFFEIPSDEHLFSIVQISRGHRKTNLMNEEEYPAALKLNNGNTVNLVYLAVLIRLADEIDIAIDRNPYELYQDYSKYNEKDIKEFNMHKSIKHLDILPDKFLLTVETDDPEIRANVEELVEKIRGTLNYCLKVLHERTDYDISQKDVEIIYK